MALKSTKGLLERLNDGQYVICAEGYVHEFERRGYLKAGAYVPEVVIEHPDLVKAFYEEFVHAGSDVVEAFTYYANRSKMQLIGREDDLEKINRSALKMARQVADETGTLMAGNICNTSTWCPNNKEVDEQTLLIFKEQIEWAVEEGADFIIAETFMGHGEAEIALKACKLYGKGLPTVVTVFGMAGDVLTDGVSIVESCKRLEEQGADVVGVNCSHGVTTMVDTMKEVRKACKGHLACLPVPYRTHPEAPTFSQLKDPDTGKRSFPLELEKWLAGRSQIEDFTKEIMDLGVKYMGICCGNRAFYTRTMAETLGRSPGASRYSHNLSQHISQVIDKDHQHQDQVAKKMGLTGGWD